MKRIDEEKLIEYLETGVISDSDAELLKNSKENQAKLRELGELLNLMANAPEKEAPPNVRWALDAAIREESSLNNGQTFRWIQVAASLGILLIGFWLGRTNSGSKEQIALLQQQITELREVTLTGVLKTHSASERILAVNQIEEVSEASSEKFVSTLIQTVNTDESPNVRYEAIQALEKFIENQVVKNELVNSLELQNDPLIQIAIIRMLVDAKEKSAVEPLRRMMDSQEVIPEVKQQAETAIKILI